MSTAGQGGAATLMTLENVDQALDQVRPILIADGGNVEVVEVLDGVVALRLQVENMLLKVPYLSQCNKPSCPVHALTQQYITIEVAQCCKIEMNWYIPPSPPPPPPLPLRHQAC